MKIVDQYHEFIDRTKLKPLELIEIAGRVCYKSEDRITAYSSEKFAFQMLKSGHLSVLEHATFCFDVSHTIWAAFKKMHVHEHKFLNMTISQSDMYISGSLRAFREALANPSQWETLFLLPVLRKLVPVVFDDMCHELPEWGRRHYAELVDLSTLTDYHALHHIYETVRFVTNRGVTHELVRHRPCAFSQESTRYVNYNNKEMEFIRPVWCGASCAQFDDELAQMRPEEDTWGNAMFSAESCYKNLVKNGWRPEMAREVLPNSLKTEIIVTANLREWLHILTLRCAKAAHPQMRALMLPVLDDFNNKFPSIFNDLYLTHSKN